MESLKQSEGLSVFLDDSGTWGLDILILFKPVLLRLQLLPAAVKELIPVVLAAANDWIQILGRRKETHAIRFISENATPSATTSRSITRMLRMTQTVKYQIQ